MIITRAPLRVGFIGGGSDYPEYFEAYPGAVLGTAINLFVYVTIIGQTALVDKKFKLTYRESEAVDSPEHLVHPVVRTVLTDMGWDEPGLHIATLADVPASTGLGSSSSFTVALIHALNLLRGSVTTAESLARGAIRIERELLAEAGGWQDQFHAAYGGTALYEFTPNDVTRRTPESEALAVGLSNSMILVPAGVPRASHGHADTTRRAVQSQSGGEAAQQMADLARSTFDSVRHVQDPDLAVNILASGIRESWELKRSLLSSAMDDDVEEMILHGLNHGAIAGRLCGAGGSGFVLFLVKPGRRQHFLEITGFNKGELIEPVEGGSMHGPTDWMLDRVPRRDRIGPAHVRQ